MLSRCCFFLNPNKKMLAPHALDIAVIISSLIASLIFTFVDIFKNFIFKFSYALVSGITNKTQRLKEGSRKGPTERVNSLTHLTPILHSAK